MNADELRHPLQEALRGLMAPKEKVERPGGWVYTSTPEGNDIAQSRLKQFDYMERAFKGLHDKTEDPKRRSRLKLRISRVQQLRKDLCNKMTMCKQSLKDCSHSVNLTNKVYNPTRPLTISEMRYDFMALNDHFNKEQESLKKQIRDATLVALLLHAKRVKSRLDAGDIAGAATASLLLQKPVKEAVSNAIRNSYNTGKALAASALGIATPATAVKSSQIMKIDAMNIAEQYQNNLEATGKSIIKAGIQKGASAEAIASRMMADMEDSADLQTSNITGTVVGQYTNQGNMDTLMDFVNQIDSFQRSEVLDDVTCAICEELDETIIEPDDPFREMDLVHSNCFVAGTKVKTRDGETNIEDIKIDDEVATHLDHWYRVYHTMASIYEGDIVEIELENGKKIFCTPNHHFWVDDRWVKSSDLAAGFSLSESLLV